jgi:lipoyl-dependent peroxiredoxin
MTFKRRSHAAWEGGAEDGGGTIALGSGAFEGAYSLRGRITEGSRETNPEELVAAAHAGCFTMSLSNELTALGHPPARLDTTATVYLENREDGYMIPRIDLRTTGQVAGIDAPTFERVADAAKQNCPLSKLLAAAEINVEATLA